MTGPINRIFLTITGPEESRTPYPLLAKQVLYQMSYRPFKNRCSFLGTRLFRGTIPESLVPIFNWWALMDSNHRPSPYQDDALTN